MKNEPIKSPYAPNMEDLPTNDPKDPHYISPQNRMDPERVKEIFENRENNKESKPIIEIIEGKITPLFIRVLNMTCLGRNMNLMITILNNKEKNKLEIRGRMKYENTGNKQIFEKEGLPYSEKNYKLIQEYVRSFMDTLVTPDTPFEQLEPANEVVFGINDTTDQIMKIMNDSNLFNIGTQKIT